MSKKPKPSDTAGKKKGRKKKIRIEKREREHFMNAVKVGQPDINNNSITSVHMKSVDFVIYEVDVPILTDSLKTIVYALDSQPGKKKVVKNFNNIMMSISDAEEVMSKAVDKNVFKGRMASAIGHALQGSIKEARKMFSNLIDQTNIDYNEQQTDRAYYRGTALLAALLMVALALFACQKDVFIPIITKLIYISAGGCIGGFLSISMSIRNMVFERGLQKRIVIVSAAERLMFSIFAACIVAVAIRLNLAFGFLNHIGAKKTNSHQEAYVIAAVVAGFSESFLPNLLVKLEKKS